MVLDSSPGACESHNGGQNEIKMFMWVFLAPKIMDYMTSPPTSPIFSEKKQNIINLIALVTKCKSTQLLSQKENKR